MPDKDLEIHLRTTADPAGVVATQQGLDRLENTAGTLVTTTAKFAHETEQATRSTNGFGQSALSAAYFVDDLQYGVKGILNNIPQLTMALGAGTGLAGVLSIAAVGFSVLSDQMGWFEEEAKTATGNLRELAIESRNAATAAGEEERRTNAAEAALAKHNTTIGNAAEKYKKLKDAIDETAKSRETMNRNIIAETDAEAALQLAKIDALKSNGTLTDQEAERNSLAVKRQAEDRKFQTEQAEARAKENDLRKEAEALRGTAQVTDEAASNLSSMGRGLLDSEGRKRAEAELKKEEARLRGERAKMEETAPYIQVPSADGEGTEMIDNPEMERQRRKVLDAGKGVTDAGRILENDRAARERTGVADADALQVKVEQERRAAQEARDRAARLEADAARSASERNSGAKVYNMDTESDTIQSETRVGAFNQKDAKEAERAEARAGKDAEARRKRSEEELQKANRSAGREIDGRADNFAARNKGGNDGGLVRELQQATENLKDGPMEAELKRAREVVLAFVGTQTAKDAQNAKALSGMLSLIETLTKDVKKNEAQQKASRP